MKLVPPDGVFKPSQSRTEAKSESTTKAARLIIDSDLENREEKTDRLRAARLALAANAVVLAPAVTKVAAKRRRVIHCR